MGEFGFSECRDTHSILIAAYTEPHRCYHTLEHIEACFRHLESAQSQADHPNEIELALWFHDAIYDPERPDNEKASGLLSTQWLEKLGEDSTFAGEVDRLINITDHKSTPETDDEQLIIDIDLSILGRDSAFYQKYADNIRKEYSFVPEDDYIKGRGDLLQHFLEREKIYLTPSFFDQFESQARVNLQGELDQLSA